MPFIDDNKYKIFSFGKTYIINDIQKEKLKKLEEYREFIWSYKPPIILILIIFSLIVSSVVSILIKKEFDSNLFKQIFVNVTWISYFIVSLIYYYKIKKVLI